MTLVLTLVCAVIWARDLPPDPSDTAEARRWQSLVPRPVEAVPASGSWTLGPELTVAWGELEAAEITSLSDRLERTLAPLGRTWREAKPGEKPGLVFDVRYVDGYSMTVSKEGVAVQSAAPQGRYYALVTLVQLLPAAARTRDPVRVSAGRITDRPAFEWRGLMLDSSRHIQSVTTIEWVLELMALHKLNRFHWHLTDDQGWRLPVAGWPRLTEVGAWRLEADGRRYGGFYSREDIRRIVAFAALRHIVVVPEIDLPGHSSAALAAYPELSASGAKREVPLDWGVADGVLSLGRRTVTRFTADLLTTLSNLFPGPWVHWGGDEVYRTPWMRNAESLAWMKAVKASTPEQAQAAFWNDLARKTQASGKTAVGWDEIAIQAPPKGTIVQWWDDPVRGLAAFKAGYSVIASWKEATYLDYPEWDGDGDRAFWMPVQTLESIAAHPFWPPGTPNSAKSLLLGIEAGLWTERADEPRLGRKLFPRLALVADLAWTGIQGGAPGWAQRISDHRERLTAWGVGMPPPAR